MTIKYRREERRPKEGDLNKNTYFLSLTIQIIRSKNETRSIGNVIMGKKLNMSSSILPLTLVITRHHGG